MGGFSTWIALIWLALGFPTITAWVMKRLHRAILSLILHGRFQSKKPQLGIIGLGISRVIVFTKDQDHKEYYQPVKKAGVVA